MQQDLHEHLLQKIDGEIDCERHISPEQSHDHEPKVKTLAFLRSIRKGISDLVLRPDHQYQYLNKAGCSSSHIAAARGNHGDQARGNLSAQQEKEYAKAIKAHQKIIKEARALVEEIGKCKYASVQIALSLAKQGHPILPHQKQSITVEGKVGTAPTVMCTDEYVDSVRRLESYAGRLQETKDRVRHHYYLMDTAQDIKRKSEAEGVYLGLKVAQKWITKHFKDREETSLAFVHGRKRQAKIDRDVAACEKMAQSILDDRAMMAGLGRPVSLHFRASPQ